jgi:hypothetical protein
MEILNVEVETPSTWPKDFRQLAESNIQLIISYQKERTRIERLGWNDVMLRLNPPTNPHKHDYLSLVQQLEAILLKHNIIGYQCSRLLPEEILDIQSSGLKILTEELVFSKIQLALNAGHITVDEYHLLKNSDHIKQHLANEYGYSTGMAWFCPNRSTLKDCGAVYRLFRSWGGEAVYNAHEEGDNEIPALRHIGIPCIIKCTFPFRDANQYYDNFSARLLSYLVAHEVDSPEPPAAFDMHINKNLAADEVLEIIELSNPLFSAVLGHKSTKVTERYTHLLDTHVQSVVERMNEKMVRV